MKAIRRLWLVALFVLMALAGFWSFLSAPLRADETDSKGAVKTADQDPKIEANLAKLSPEDRKLAEAQKWCVIENDNLLGSMGVPIKVLVKGQPVFLCCKGCKDDALADPDKTLAKVKELKAKAAQQK